MDRRWGIVVSLVILGTVSMATARAQAISWTGLGVPNTDWFTAGNWSSGTVPTASDDVTIALSGGATVIINNMLSPNSTCKTLTIGGANPQTVDLGTGIGNTLTIVSTCTINSLGTLTIGSGGILTGGTTTVNTGGTLALAPSGTLSSTTVNVTSTGVFNITGGAINTSTTVNNSGTTAWSGAGFSMSGNTAFNNLAGATFAVNTNGISITSSNSATFVNSGTFVIANSASSITSVGSGISFTNNGVITLPANPTLSINSLTNYSGSTLTGGQYVLNNTLNLGATGVIATNSANIVLGTSTAGFKDGSGGVMLNGLATNSALGVLSLSGGAKISCSALINAGSVTISGTGTAIQASTANYTQTGGITTLATGGSISATTIDLQGGTLVAQSSTSVNASVNNAAQIMVLAGQTLTVSGSYTQSSGGVFAPVIASAASVGLLSVTGTATLGGTVNANIQAAYMPAPGDTWKVITFGSASGQFTTVLPTLTANAEAVSQVVNANNITLKTGAAPPPPLISNVTSSLPVVETNSPVTFTATASDPSSLPLTYSWNFGDGSPLMTGNPITYSYLIEGNFTVTVTVSNPGTSAAASLQIATFAPNSGGQGVSNIGVGNTVTDPLTNLGMTIMNSDGGVIELGIDVTNLRSLPVNVSTEMDGIGSRSAAVSGITPVFKSTSPGVFVATATATDPTSNALKGKGRLTIAVSGPEVGQSSSTTPPGNKKISKVKLKGKFNFAKADTLDPLAGSVFDTVGMTGTIELPAGFDVSTKHEIDIGIGNIIDAMQVDAKGKAILPGGGKVVKKLGVKYPRLKGSTKTSAGQSATISLTMAGSNFSGNGFDTEGITNNLTAAEKASKSINRSIQMAVVVDGQPYTLMAPVGFSLSKNGSTGTMGTRSGP